MKEGTDSDKAKLTSEVRANMVPLSKSKYGRHVVQKLINIAPKEEVPGGCGMGTQASLWVLISTECVEASGGWGGGGGQGVKYQQQHHKVSKGRVRNLGMPGWAATSSAGHLCSMFMG
jgi:hypothetical protein